MAVYQGIDVGTTGVRKITISGGWGNYQSTPNAKPAKKVMTLPSNFITYRQFKFPFQDKKRIREVLPGELMDSLVFPIDQVVWDISSIHKDRANAIVIPKHHIAEFTTANDEQVQALDAEPCSLIRAAGYSDVDNALIIDFGARKTTFIGVKNGRMDLLRVKMAGGSDLDLIIADELQLTPEEAEQIKGVEGLSNKTVHKFIENLLTTASLPNPLSYNLILITGGGSLTPGIQDLIAEKLNLPVRFFNMPQDLSPHFDVVAFGAALHYTAGQEKVNFKEHKDESTDKPYIKLALILIPLIIWCVNLKLTESQLSKQNKQIMQTITETVRREIPELKGIPGTIALLETVKKTVKDLQSGNVGGSESSMEILANISKARGSMNITIYELDIADNSVKIRGEADTFQIVEDFQNSLKTVFSKVDTPEQKKKPNDKIDFSMKFNAEKEQEEAKPDEPKR